MLKRMIISGMNKHKFYNFIHDIFKDCNYNAIMMESLCSRYSFGGRFKRFNFMFKLFDIIYLPIFMLKHRKADFVFLREFNTGAMLFSAPLCFPFRKKMLLNNNHNLQSAYQKSSTRLCIKILDACGFRFFMFESSQTPVTLRKPVLSASFPILKQSPKLSSDNKVAIGVIGSYRKEKQIEELLQKLSPLKLDFSELTLIFGSDNSDAINLAKNLGWETYVTTNDEDYRDALNKSNILIINYAETDYKFRHSGVLTDSIVAGKIIVAPDYPVFRQQLTTPVSVGCLFDGFDNLIPTVHAAINLLHNKNECKLAFDKYCEFRSKENVINEFNVLFKTLLEKK